MKTNRNPAMVKGGALYYAIFVSFITTMICGFFLLSTHFTNQFVETSIQQDRLSRNVRSGINFMLANPSTISSGEQLKFDLYDDREDIVTLEKKKWGIYDILTCSANWKSFHELQMVLTGEDISDAEPIALYFAENNRYLSLSGSSKIEGNAYLPNLGIKRAHIEGESLRSDTMVYGRVKTSDKRLPGLSPGMINPNLDVLENGIKDHLKTIPFRDLSSFDSLSNSFEKLPLLIRAKDDVSIRKITLSGNIIILASGLVEIYPDARLKDVIIYCHKAGIADQTEGSFQVFARDTVWIGENVTMIFPSSIVILNDDLNPVHLHIGNNSRLSGGVIVYNRENPGRPSDLYIGEGAQINGQVYCDGIVEHKGRINGSLYCRGFKLSTSRGYYENHILNAQISYTGLSEFYVGYSMLANNKNEIIKWLN